MGATVAAGARGTASSLAFGLQVASLVKRRSADIGRALNGVMCGAVPADWRDPTAEGQGLDGRVADVLDLLAGFHSDAAELAARIDGLFEAAAESAAFLVDVAESLDRLTDAGGDHSLAKARLDDMVDCLRGIAIDIEDVARLALDLNDAAAAIEDAAEWAGELPAARWQSADWPAIRVTGVSAMMSAPDVALAEAASWRPEFVGKLTSLQAGLRTLAGRLDGGWQVAKGKQAAIGW